MASLKELLFNSPRVQAAAASPSDLAVAADAAERAMLGYMRRRRHLLEEQVGSRGRDALCMLPFLLHVNQPGLPGFVAADDCPLGVSGYAPSNRELDLARKLFRGAQPKRSGVLEPAIDLVMVMGSAGSIGFTEDSDLDVWVCHNRAIGHGTSLRRYREKVQAVEQWLNDYSGLEVHLFLQATERIRDNDFGETDVEGCGSAMGALLKEEFYRTAVHIAGRNPFWWLVPPACEPETYRAHLEQLRADPTFATDGYVDLGWVAQVPVGELFGAAIWQIVKGWKSPFKSALKMGLLERAVHAGADILPLCEMLKGQVLDGAVPDPYRVMFDQVLAYYRARQDTATEDLLARCFYLKTAIRLDPERLDSPSPIDPNHAVLAEYVRGWGWGTRRVRHLNEFEQWRFEWLRGLAQEVDKFFLRTYRRLRTALDQCGESQRITPRDLTILGRKLQTVYRSAAHKIETVHLLIRGKAESSLSLYQETLPDGESPWRLYRGRVTPLNVDEHEGELLRMSDDLIDLLVWACQNGLLGPGTSLSCKSVDRQLATADLEGLAQSILEFVGRVHQAAPPLDDLLEAPRPTSLLVIPNLGLKAEELRELGAVYATTWGEMFYQRWSGSSAQRTFSEEVLFPFVATSPSPESVEVYAQQQKVGGLRGPARRLQQQLPGIVEYLAEGGTADQVKRRHVGPEAAGYFVIERVGGEAAVYRSFRDADGLLRYFSGVGPHRRVDTRVEGQFGDLALLRTMFDAASPGRIDVFCLEQAEHDTLFVVDEVGNLAFFRSRPENEPYALAKLLHFLEGILPEVAGHPGNPLSAPILGEVVRIHSLLFDGNCRVQTSTQEHLGRVQALGLQPKGLTIEKTRGRGRRAPGFRITWGERVFQSKPGSNPLEEVRHEIEQARHSGLGYHAYVTRLFLDDAFQKDYCGPFTATGHFLFYKNAIEQRLTGPPTG